MRASEQSRVSCVQVRETVRDVAFLHSEQFFAAAQKKYVYIYDKRGLEVHCLKVRGLAMHAHFSAAAAHALAGRSMPDVAFFSRFSV